MGNQRRLWALLGEATMMFLVSSGRGNIPPYSLGKDEDTGAGPGRGSALPCFCRPGRPDQGRAGMWTVCSRLTVTGLHGLTCYFLCEKNY